ncbi:MAG: hypothetical protein EOM72_12750 [Opitutae bacterium]|nr:hypothetical protein [Opitutae bacterium]
MGLREKPEVGDAGANARPASGCRAIWALLWKLALLLLLVYGALQLFVRTGFFRARVEAELSRLTGMEMRAGRIRATESLNLRIRDVISVSKDAGLEARTVRIRWRLFRPQGVSMLESVRVDGLAVTFAPDEEGVVQPAFLGRVSRMVLDSAGASLPDAAGAMAPPDADSPAAGGDFPEKMGGPVEIRWASARWQDAAGNLLASVSNLELIWVAMALPNGGRVSHLDCRAAEVKVVNGPRITGLHVELLDAGGRRFLMDLDASDWGAARKPRAAAADYRELLDAMDRGGEDASR